MTTREHAIAVLRECADFWEREYAAHQLIICKGKMTDPGAWLDKAVEISRRIRQVYRDLERVRHG